MLRRLRPKRSMQDRAAADWVGARYVACVCVRVCVTRWMCARACETTAFLCHAFLEFGNRIMYRRFVKVRELCLRGVRREAFGLYCEQGRVCNTSNVISCPPNAVGSLTRAPQTEHPCCMPCRASMRASPSDKRLT